MQTELLNISSFFTLFFILVSVFTDLKWKKVPNNLVLLTFFCCLCLQLYLSGFSSFVLILTSLLTAAAMLMPLWFLNTLGGGDIKLIFALAPLFNWKEIAVFVLVSFIWGGLLGLFRAFLSGEGLKLLKNVYFILIRLPVEKSQLHSMPFTVAILFGYLSLLSLKSIHWGWL